jgi:adenylosuccinate synthase
MMSVTVVVGGQYGSEGKGKICAHLALSENIDFIVRCGGPNSGHTVNLGGEIYELRQVPAGFINPSTRLLVAAGALISPRLFLHEVTLCRLDPSRIGIDRNAAIIENSDVDAERSENLRARLGSTGVGVGAAVSRRVLRSPSLRLAADVAELKPFLTNTSEEVNQAVRSGKSVVVEGTQGFGLSLYHTELWPFCTSRDTTAHSFLGEVGLGVRDFEVIMAIRTYPIRVGGNSGPLPTELTWEEIRHRSRYPHSIDEYTTTTKRLRRVADFSWDVIDRAVAANSPSQLAVHGVDYLDFSNKLAKSFTDLTDQAKDFISALEERTEVPVTLIGTGPDIDEIIDLRVSEASRKLASREVKTAGRRVAV